MSHISIRIEEKTKQAATETLDALGLDMSTAVKMFLQQVVTEQGLPFQPSRNPEYLAAKWNLEVEQALTTAPRYQKAADLLAAAESDIAA